MATNRESKTSSRSTGASAQPDKPNGSAAKTGNSPAYGGESTLNSGASMGAGGGTDTTTSSGAGSTASLGSTGSLGSSSSQGSTGTLGSAGSTGTPGNGGTGAGNGSTLGSGILGGVKQRVTSRVDEQKNRAADGLGGIADVFRTAGNELRNENEALAQYVDMASDQMRRFANTIRERGVADMLDDVTAFARRRPAVFIGGAFLVGIGIARFLKASGERRTDDRSYDNFSSVDPMTSSGTGSPSYSGDLGEVGGY